MTFEMAIVQVTDNPVIADVSQRIYGYIRTYALPFCRKLVGCLMKNQFFIESKHA